MLKMSWAESITNEKVLNKMSEIRTQFTAMFDEKTKYINTIKARELALEISCGRDIIVEGKQRNPITQMANDREDAF